VIRCAHHLLSKLGQQTRRVGYSDIWGQFGADYLDEGTLQSVEHREPCLLRISTHLLRGAPLISMEGLFAKIAVPLQL